MKSQEMIIQKQKLQSDDEDKVLPKLDETFYCLLTRWVASRE